MRSKLPWFCSGLALAAALGGFALPQRTPLEFHPLNEPSAGQLSLEITCASNVPGEVQIFFDTGRGINQIESIRWPITPSIAAYTYTFPLADAPIREMRLDPPTAGEFTITNFRFLNRRHEEIFRILRESIQATHEIADIVATTSGCKVIATHGGDDPFAQIELSAPVVPDGMNERNFQRCLRSGSYLSLMIWILLLGLYFSLSRDRKIKKICQAVSTLALVALIFSAIVHRGLIKNSWRVARFQAPVIQPGIFLEMDVSLERPGRVRLAWEAGSGFTASDGAWSDPEKREGLQTLRFPLPANHLRELRLDPFDNEGNLQISRVRLVDQRHYTQLILSPRRLRTEQPLDGSRGDADDVLRARLSPGASPPVFLFDAEAVQEINGVLGSSQTKPELTPPSRRASQ